MDNTELNHKKIKFSGKNISGQTWKLEYNGKEVVSIQSSSLRLKGTGSYDGRAVMISPKINLYKPAIISDLKLGQEVCNLSRCIPPAILTMPNGVQFNVVSDGFGITGLHDGRGRKILQTILDRGGLKIWTELYVEFFALEANDPNPWLLTLATAFISLFPTKLSE